MSYLLDTNTCSRYINAKSTEIVSRLESVPPTAVFLCSVVKAELLYGLEKAQPPAEKRRRLEVFLSLFPSLPFDDRAAEVYARVRAELERRGELIGPNDLQIASIALAHDLTLVTHHRRVQPSTGA